MQSHELDESLDNRVADVVALLAADADETSITTAATCLIATFDAWRTCSKLPGAGVWVGGAGQGAALDIWANDPVPDKPGARRMKSLESSG
jgi:hypothetical protein